MRLKSKINLLIILFLLFIIAVLSGQLGFKLLDLYLWKTNEVISMVSAGKTIVLDPGHGGEDPGATSSFGGQEKEIVLKIALDLKNYLEESGATVVLTRDGDYDLVDRDRAPGKTKKRSDLENRRKLVEAVNGDLLISIHVNSITSSRWSGAQVFYSAHLEENRLLSGMLQESLKKNLGGTTRVAKEIDAYIVRTAQIPSALVEVGFISHPREGRLLRQREYQRRIAYSIYRGISEYFLGQFRY